MSANYLFLFIPPIENVTYGEIPLSSFDLGVYLYGGLDLPEGITHDGGII